jgi:hypothetical protein
VAVIIAIGVNTDGRREVLGLEIGTSEAEPIWTEFLRKLKRRIPVGARCDLHRCNRGCLHRMRICERRGPEVLPAKSRRGVGTSIGAGT